MRVKLEEGDPLFLARGVDPTLRHDPCVGAVRIAEEHLDLEKFALQRRLDHKIRKAEPVHTFGKVLLDNTHEIGFEIGDLAHFRFGGRLITSVATYKSNNLSVL